MRLNYSRRCTCSFVSHHMHKKLVIFSLLHSLKHIFRLYFLHANTIALQLFEHRVLKSTHQYTTGFCSFQEKERRILLRGDNFCQLSRRPRVSQVHGEKLVTVRMNKSGHTCMHTHTQDKLPYSPTISKDNIMIIIRNTKQVLLCINEKSKHTFYWRHFIMNNMQVDKM